VSDSEIERGPTGAGGAAGFAVPPGFVAGGFGCAWLVVVTSAIATVITTARMVRGIVT
jgi:hypothetical protein